MDKFCSTETFACLLADFKGMQFYVARDFDVTDDVNVFTVGELHVVAIGKFYFKRISNQFHLNLHKKKLICGNCTCIHIHIYVLTIEAFTSFTLDPWP